MLKKLLVLLILLLMAPVTAQDEQYITESYLRRKIECNTLAHIIGDIYGDLAYNGAWFNHPNCDDWYEKGEMHAILDGHGYSMDSLVTIKIKDRFYQPGGQVLRSDPQDLDEGVVTTGEYSSIRNHGQEPIEHDVDKSVSLEQSQSSTLDMGITLDLTTKASAGYAGVTAELETHLGITVNKSESQSSSKTVTTTFSDKISVDPGEEVAVVYKKTDKRYSQDYTINALIDIAFDVCLADHHGRPTGEKWHYISNDQNKGLWEGSCMSFKSIHDFVAFVLGFDVRAPAMHDYSHHWNDRASRGVGTLKENTHNMLSLVLSGTDYIVHDDDADYSVEDISGMSDDEVKDEFGKEGNSLGN